ncbi:hypothetical protein OROHE_027170 [Orobanche hederae]
MELDEGIWNDLREVQEMVSISMPHTSDEWVLFSDLCERYAPENVNSVSTLPYRGSPVKGSFLTSSSGIIWNSAERYDIVRKLGEYRRLVSSEYDALVSDHTEFGPAIPNINWYTRLANDVINTSYIKCLLRLYRRVTSSVQDIPRGSFGFVQDDG